MQIVSSIYWLDRSNSSKFASSSVIQRTQILKMKVSSRTTRGLKRVAKRAKNIEKAIVTIQHTLDQTLPSDLKYAASFLSIAAQKLIFRIRKNFEYIDALTVFPASLRTKSPEHSEITRRLLAYVPFIKNINLTRRTYQSLSNLSRLYLRANGDCLDSRFWKDLSSVKSLNSLALHISNQGEGSVNPQIFLKELLSMNSLENIVVLFDFSDFITYHWKTLIQDLQKDAKTNLKNETKFSFQIKIPEGRSGFASRKAVQSTLWEAFPEVNKEGFSVHFRFESRASEEKIRFYFTLQEGKFVLNSLGIVGSEKQDIHRKVLSLAPKITAINYIAKDWECLDAELFAIDFEKNASNFHILERLEINIQGINCKESVIPFEVVSRMTELRHLVINFEVKWDDDVGFRTTETQKLDKFVEMVRGKPKLKTFKLKLLTFLFLDRLDRLCQELFKLPDFEEFEVTVRCESLDEEEKYSLLHCLAMKPPVQITRLHVESLDESMQGSTASRVEYLRQILLDDEQMEEDFPIQGLISITFRKSDQINKKLVY